MNNFPEFSIVTVCFNSEKTIRTTIESVLQQKYKNYEYIIVDGASIDGTMDIVKSYETKFEGRLRYISEPDKGIYDAFNKGVRMSTGKYVWIVNSDDYIEPNALEELATITTKYSKEDAPVINGGMRLITNNNQTIYTSSADKAMRAYKEDRMGAPHPSTLIPKNIYNIVGLYDDRYFIASDLAWFHKAHGMGIKYLFIDTVITNMTDIGISSRPNIKKDIKDRKIYFSTKYKNWFTRIYRFTLWSIRYCIKYIKWYKNH